MKGFSVIDPNSKAVAPVKNWKHCDPLKTSLAMRLALERASAAQPPISAMTSSASDKRQGSPLGKGAGNR